jgi:flagellar hook protein FlgE
MYSGVSGLTAEGQALGVIGDNVANTNTVGFKQSRGVFEDVLGSAIGSTGAGSGVRMVRAQQIFAQGTLLTTGQPTDLALSGDGFFVVQGTVDGVTGTFFTRAGQMNVRQDGVLVNASGLQIAGYTADPSGGFQAALGPIQVPTSSLEPKATSEMTFTMNLDSTAPVPANPFLLTDPANTSNYSTGMIVYDSLGQSHTVTVYFNKTLDNTWDYHAVVDGGEVGGNAGENVEFASGTLSFTPNGLLNDVTINAPGDVTFTGASPQTIAFNLGTPISQGGSGSGATSQFDAAQSTVSSQGQDGYPSGDFTGVKIDSSGVVNATFSNGQSVAVGQLAVAKFRSNDGLGRAGHNLWTATRDSGEAALGPAGGGGRGAIVAGALEQSNVDIATQFVDLIAHQRAFSANSKTITTADEMMQELVNLKR